jgi:hypothetical protein
VGDGRVRVRAPIPRLLKTAAALEQRRAKGGRAQALLAVVEDRTHVGFAERRRAQHDVDRMPQRVPLERQRALGPRRSETELVPSSRRSHSTPFRHADLKAARADTAKEISRAQLERRQRSTLISRAAGSQRRVCSSPVFPLERDVSPVENTWRKAGPSYLLDEISEEQRDRASMPDVDASCRSAGASTIAACEAGDVSTRPSPQPRIVEALGRLKTRVLVCPQTSNWEGWE